MNGSKILCLESNEIYRDNRPTVYISGYLSLIGVLKTLCSSHTWKESE